jgi:phytoene dehydrogenase-like protein
MTPFSEEELPVSQIRPRNPGTPKVYDVCVVGSQVGGILAGALLAKRGYRVLHVDHDGLGAGYQDGGYLFPFAPALLPQPKGLPAVEAALGELGLMNDFTRQLESGTPDIQVLMPRHRIDLHRDPAARAAEIRREWPEAAPALEGALDRLLKHGDWAAPFLKGIPPLPPQGWSDRFALRRAQRAAHGLKVKENPIGDAVDHPLMRALLAAQRFMTYQSGPPSPLSLARLLGTSLRGLFRLPGGYEGLRDLIRKKIVEARGEVLGEPGQPAIAESLEMENRRVVGIKVAGSPNAYRARAFVAATDSAALRRLIPPAATDNKLVALLDKVQPRWQLFTLNMVVKAQAIPPGLGETAFVMGEGIETNPEVGDDAVLLQVLPARREGRRPTDDERIVCASTFSATRSRDLGEESAVKIASRVRRTVADVLPFYEKHLVRESIPGLAAAETPRGSRMMPHPLYEVGLDQSLGVTGLPPRSRYKNLVLAGREVVPGLGLEGEFHAGMQAAHHLTQMLFKKDPLR